MKFKPVSHSWVALHPQPQGVVQFIGGAFVGTFGTSLFYRHLLSFFYDRHYTIIILPFNFTFNHYREAGFLIAEQYEILPEIVRLAKLEDYSYDAYLDNQNFYWLGHSIGCKYITLLEGFSALPESDRERKLFITEILSQPPKPRNPEQIDRIVLEVESLIEYLQQRANYAKDYIQAAIGQDIVLGERIATLFIKGQPSVFLAPDNSNTQSAIQIEFIAKLLDNYGLGVSPTPEETINLIIKSNLFNKLGLIAFDADTTARETVSQFVNRVKKPAEQYRVFRVGGHFRPIGFTLVNVVINIIDFLYGWLRFLTRIDSDVPGKLTPLVQSIEQRNNELEDATLSFYLKLQASSNFK